jgi:hypothetical protein
MVLSENYVLFEARVDFTRSDESTSCTIIRTFLGLSIYRFAMFSSTGQAGYCASLLESHTLVFPIWEQS